MDNSVFSPLNEIELDNQLSSIELPKYQRFNLLLGGNSGAGKSTITNSIFNFHLAKTGMGKPQTLNITKYSKEGYPLCIYDTRGIELATKNGSNSFKDLEALIEKIRNSKDPSEQIDIAWIVIPQIARFEESHKQFMQILYKHNIPIIIVLTQCTLSENECHKMDGIRRELVNSFKSTEYSDLISTPIHSIVAEEIKLKGGSSIKPFGMLNLLQQTASLVPKGKRASLVAVQTVCEKAKYNEAHIAIASFAATAGLSDAISLPFSGDTKITAIHYAMYISIFHIYFPSIPSSKLSKCISLFFSSNTYSSLAKKGSSFVTSCIKLIPGIGTLTGGIISGISMAAFTELAGVAFLLSLREFYFQNINKLIDQKKLETLFEGISDHISAAKAIINEEKK